MLLSLFSPSSRTLVKFGTHLFDCRRICGRAFSASVKQMGSEKLGLIQKRKRANFRLASVSGFKTELIEIHNDDPALHIVFIPGNPGLVSFYTDFLESLYEFLGGTASITAVGHISHSEKDWECGRLFSLQEQIDHKISFVQEELLAVDRPIVLVGHSIGAYISLETFKRCQEKATYCICLYPFLTVNPASSAQAFIKRIAMSAALRNAVSSMGSLLGMLPVQILRFLAKNSIGKSWSSSAVEVLCSHVLQYHTIQNVLYMAMFEFQKLLETPDWGFIQGKKNKIAFLFGDDDHWGPLHLYDEIIKQVPGACAAVEREGHTHAFSCSDVGSVWVAQYVSSLIKGNSNNLKQGSS